MAVSATRAARRRQRRQGALNHPILLYDGVCNLCDASVQFVLRHERAPDFHFVALQSERAASLLAGLGVALPDSLSSVLVLDHGQLYRESEAVLRVLSYLHPPWRWLTLCRWLPRGLRDRLYRFVGAHRYRWFGRRDGGACLLVPADRTDRSAATSRFH